ncbi:MAG: element excision factor XisH family protein [Cyanobacteria bacterium P01_C01_bin.89]
MPRRDFYHDTVKAALEKDGWQVTHDPLMLGDPELRVYADLCVTKTIGNTTQRLTIEIKVFGSYAKTSELEKAIGQYALYRSILKHDNAQISTYLAIPNHIYRTFFQKRIVRNVIQDENIKLIVFNPDTEEIEAWIE